MKALNKIGKMLWQLDKLQFPVSGFFLNSRTSLKIANGTLKRLILQSFMFPKFNGTYTQLAEWTTCFVSKTELICGMEHITLYGSTFRVVTYFKSLSCTFSNLKIQNIGSCFQAKKKKLVCAT